MCMTNPYHSTDFLPSRWRLWVILNLLPCSITEPQWPGDLESSALQHHRVPIIHNARRGISSHWMIRKISKNNFLSTSYSWCGLSLGILLPASHALNIVSMCREAVRPFTLSNLAGNRTFHPKEWMGKHPSICHLQLISGQLDFYSLTNSFALYSYIPCFLVLTHDFEELRPSFIIFKEHICPP